MRDAWRAGAAAATTAISAAVALAGCGGTSAQHGEAAKSAQQIAADAAAAATHLHSFRLAGTFTEQRGTTRVTAAVAGPGRVSFSEQRPSDSVQVIALGSATYMKASRGYYAAQPKLTPEQVTTYANRWLKLSTASNPAFAPPAPSQRPLALPTSRSATSTSRSRWRRRPPRWT